MSSRSQLYELAKKNGFPGKWNESGTDIDSLTRYLRQLDTRCKETPCRPPEKYAAGFERVNNPALVKEATGEKNEGKLYNAQTYKVRHDNILIYRLWNSTSTRSEKGRWWTFSKPEGRVEFYRRDYVICPGWSPLDRLSTAYLKKGTIVVLGNGQSVECKRFRYGQSDSRQIYIPDPEKLVDVSLVGKLHFYFK